MGKRAVCSWIVAVALVLVTMYSALASDTYSFNSTDYIFFDNGDLTNRSYNTSTPADGDKPVPSTQWSIDDAFNNWAYDADNQRIGDMALTAQAADRATMYIHLNDTGARNDVTVMITLWDPGTGQDGFMVFQIYNSTNSLTTQFGIRSDQQSANYSYVDATWKACAGASGARPGSAQWVNLSIHKNSTGNTLNFYTDWGGNLTKCWSTVNGGDLAKIKLYKETNRGIYSFDSLMVWDGGIDDRPTPAGAPAATENFTINGFSTLGGAIGKFNATVNSTFFNGTDTIETNFTAAADHLFNIEVTATNFFSVSETNYNSSIDPYVVNLTPYALINVTDYFDGTGLVVNATIYNSTHDTSYTNQDGIRPNFRGSHFINISRGGYYNLTGIAVTLSSGTKNNLSIWESQLTWYAREWITNKTLLIFNATASDGTTTQALTNSSGSILFKLKAGTYSINTVAPGYFNRTQSATTTSLNSTNGTEYLRSAQLNITAKHTNGTTINTFNATFSYGGTTFTQGTSTGLVQAYLINGSWNVSIDPPNYLDNHTLLTIDEMYEAYEFSLWATNTINITFYHEVNLTKMGNTTIFAELISDTVSYIFNTTEPNVSQANIYEELISPATYTVRYYDQYGIYSDRFYEFTLTNRTYNEFSLYMLETSTGVNVTLTVIDENGEELEDVEVRVLRYNVGTNTYTVTQTPVTNFEGECILQGIELNTEYYKFQLYYNGALEKTTEPTYITSTTLSIQINVGGDPGEDYFTQSDIFYILNYTDSTNNFNFEYSDPAGTTTQGCLAVYTWTPLSETLHNSSCNSGSSGVVLVKATAVNGTTYKAYGYVTYGGENHYLATLYKSWSENRDTGVLGPFLVFLLVMLAGLVAVRNPEVGVVLAGFVPMLASFTRVFKAPTITTVPFVVLGIVLAVIIGRRGS